MKTIYNELIKKAHPKAIGLGFNYINPAKKIEESLLPKHPVVFEKPLSSLIYRPESVRLDGLNPISHEVELGLVIGKRGKNIERGKWEEYVGGYFVLIDFTMKADGIIDKNAPWFLRKGMDNFFVIGDYLEKQLVSDPHSLGLSLNLNGKSRQESSTEHMIFKIPDVLEYVSKFMTLNEGDLILTGTPPGADIVSNGDKLKASISTAEGKILDSLHFSIDIS